VTVGRAARWFVPPPPRAIVGFEGEAMRFAVYSAVAIIVLGSVLLGLDWLSAPMSPMADTEAGLRAVAPPPAPVVPRVTTNAPIAPPVAVTPKANIGAPIVSPKLVAPSAPVEPAQAGIPAQPEPPASIVTPEAQPSQASCNVQACTAAYRSFTSVDCTYQPSNGPRRLCTK